MYTMPASPATTLLRCIGSKKSQAKQDTIVQCLQGDCVLHMLHACWSGAQPAARGKCRRNTIPSTSVTFSARQSVQCQACRAAGVTSKEVTHQTHREKFIAGVEYIITRKLFGASRAGAQTCVERASPQALIVFRRCKSKRVDVCKTCEVFLCKSAPRACGCESKWPASPEGSLLGQQPLLRRPRWSFFWCPCDSARIP